MHMKGDVRSRTLYHDNIVRMGGGSNCIKAEILVR